MERFSIADNQLEEIPAEFGLVSKLTEITLSRNKLSEIPQELYKLTHLRKLSLARNSLKQLPEVGSEVKFFLFYFYVSLIHESWNESQQFKFYPKGINGWKNLKTLDVAGNHLSMFPVNVSL